MLHTLFEGILLGLTVAIMMGPAFFALIQTSIHRGFRSGLFLAFGIFLSDTMIVILGYLGVSRIVSTGANALIFGIIGGIVLIIFGMVTFSRKVVMENREEVARKIGFMTYILKGFFLNFANPFIWIFWMSIVVLVTSNYVGDSQSIFLFLGVVLITILITDFTKCFIAHKIKSYLKPRFLQSVNHVVGIGLVLFGIILIIRVIINFNL